MRLSLVDKLTAAGATGFEFIKVQRGMFSYTGLSAEQADRLRNEHAVYLLRSGRICIAGLNRGNVDRTAEAIAAVVRG